MEMYRLTLVILFLLMGKSSGLNIFHFMNGDHVMSSSVKDDNNILEGSPLEINCTINQIYAEDHDMNSSDMYFTMYNRAVNQSYVHIIDTYTAQLNYPAVWIHNYSDFKTMAVIGMVNVSDGSGDLICYSSLHVGRVPQTPEIRHCQSYNWKTVTCNWDPVIQNTGHTPTTSRLFWRSVASNGRSKWKLCVSSDNKGNCTFNLTQKPSSVVEVKVEANNSLGLKTSPTKSLTIIDIVQPKRIANVRTMCLSSNSIKISWVPCRNSGNKTTKFHYMIKYRKLSSPKYIKTMTLKGKQHTVQLKVLEPYTKYSVSVQCKAVSVTSKGTTGYWSEPTVRTFITNMIAPEFHPEVFAGAFSITPLENDKQRRNVSIYWKGIPKSAINGPSVRYRVDYNVIEVDTSHVDSYTNKYTAVDSAELKIKKNAIIHASVAATNKVGISPDVTKPIFIPSQDALPILIKRVIAMTLQNDKIVQVKWKLLEAVSSVTVVWCRRLAGPGHRCESNTDWVTLTGDTSEYNVTLPAGEEVALYIFGVTAERNKVYSGITWADCTFESSALGSLPTHIKVQDTLHANQLEVKWAEPPCTRHQGYVSHVLIYYCLWDVIKGVCKKSEQSSMVAIEDKSNILDELESGETYSVQVVSMSSRGQSARSQPSLIVVPRTWNTPAVWVGITIVLLLMLVGAAVVLCKLKRKIYELFQLEIKTPEQVYYDETAGQETDVQYNHQLGGVSSSSCNSAISDDSGIRCNTAFNSAGTGVSVLPDSYFVGINDGYFGMSSPKITDNMINMPHFTDTATTGEYVESDGNMLESQDTAPCSSISDGKLASEVYTPHSIEPDSECVDINESKDSGTCLTMTDSDSKDDVTVHQENCDVPLLKPAQLENDTLNKNSPVTNTSQAYVLIPSICDEGHPLIRKDSVEESHVSNMILPSAYVLPPMLTGNGYISHVPSKQSLAVS